MGFLNAGPLPTWNETVTVLNKRSGLDSPDRLDAWKKTVLKGCFWSVQRTQGQSDTEIALGGSYLVRLPQQKDYRPYQEWNPDMEGVTFSPGDYIIRGEAAEEITPETVQAVVEHYRPDAFEVRLFKDNTVGPLPHYRLEGV